MVVAAPNHITPVSSYKNVLDVWVPHHSIKREVRLHEASACLRLQDLIDHLSWYESYIDPGGQETRGDGWITFIDKLGHNLLHPCCTRLCISGDDDIIRS